MTDGPVIPVQIHRVALTSINVPTSEGGTSLYPVIGAWADLSPIAESGMEMHPEGEGAIPMLVVADSVLDAVNPAIVNLLITQARPFTDEAEAPIGVLGSVENGPQEHAERILDGPVGPIVAFGPCWSLRVPTAWVGALNAVNGSPLQLRLILLDGTPPLAPEEAVLTLADAGVVVMPTVAGVNESLTQVMQPEWTMPLGMAPVASAPDPGMNVLPINVMRDLTWSAVAGLALGQEVAWTKVSTTMSGYVAHLMGSDDPEDQRRAEAVMEACEWAVESSSAYLLPRDEVGGFTWPDAMTGLTGQISDGVNLSAVEAFENGHTFDDVVEAFGAGPAFTAMSVTVAARAVVAANHPDEQVPGVRWTSSYLLGVWFDAEADDPWWATRATGGSLMYHDTQVLANLLAARPGHGDHEDESEGDVDPHGPLAHRMFHVMAEALSTLGLSRDEFAAKAAGLDVKPAGFADIVYVSQTLLTHIHTAVVAGDGQCAGCYAVDQLIAETLDQDRLVRVVAAAFPVLADLTAQVQGHQVGDEDWLAFRERFFVHWLAHTAIVPAQ